MIFFCQNDEILIHIIRRKIEKMPKYVPLTKMCDLNPGSTTEMNSSQKYPRLYVQGIPVGTTEVFILTTILNVC